MTDFCHQVVRDLAWCCSSAPLLAHLPATDAAIWPSKDGVRHEQHQWLRQLDQNPAPLLSQLAQQKSTRLGLYYESLWAFYWQHHSQWQLLGHNLQVPDNGRTLGAFDFLLQKNPAEFWHVETAVKFYLGVPPSSSAFSEWQQWIGPNCNDRLDIKLERLQQHQLQLSKQEAGLAKLATLPFHNNGPEVSRAKLPETSLLKPPGALLKPPEALTQKPEAAFVHWRRALCLQGYFFYPAHGAMAPPIAANPAHGRGLWWYLQDFTESLRKQRFEHTYWIILPRHHWLSAAYTEDINELLCGESLIASLLHWVGDNNRPQLLAAMVKRGNSWQESQRGFVVPNHWPRTA